MRIQISIARNQSILFHVLFFAFFLGQSLLNYWNFRLPALDQGIANQALYGFAHLQNNPCTLLIGQANAPYLSLHMSLWVPLLSPFYYLFGFYTLFVFQALFVVLGGFFIQQIARNYQLSNAITYLLVAQFYFCWAWIPAFADGYHENSIAACLVPMLFWAFQTQHKKFIWLAFICMIICKENVSIWLFFMLPSFLVITKNTKKLGIFTLFLMLFCVLYFAFVSMVLMPLIDTQHQFQQLSRYSYLGSNLAEILQSILLHPIKMLVLFFKSHVQPDDLEIMKWELWLLLLFSGFWTVFFSPILLLAFLPLLAQKLWNKEVVFWGINHHYNVEFAPLLAIASIIFIAQLQYTKRQKIGSILLLSSTIFITSWVLFNRKSIWYDQVKENFLMPTHYNSVLNKNDVNSLASLIPAQASLSTNSLLVPHFCDRAGVYLFPNIEQAAYLLLLNTAQDTYPLGQDAYLNKLADFNKKESSSFELVATNQSLSLYRRIKN
jgi:uncharacterized membrane protein